MENKPQDQIEATQIEATQPKAEPEKTKEEKKECAIKQVFEYNVCESCD